MVLGDNTNSGEKKYYKKLKKIEKKYGIKILWVKGNHDDKDFKILGPYEYDYQFKGITFTIKDNSRCYKEYCIFDETGGDIILQHIPPLMTDTCEKIPNYTGEKIIWSGHWHSDMICDKVRIFPALTEHKKLNYKIISL